MKENLQSFFDFHVHSSRSPDGSSTPKQIVEAAVTRGLTGFALTDHDTMAGFPEVEELAKDNGLIAISGAEITSTYTPRFFEFPGIKKLHIPRQTIRRPSVAHLLVMGIPHEENLPKWWRFPSPSKVAEWTHSFENGVVIAAHPKKNGGASSLDQAGVFNLAKDGHLDGLEVANPLGINHEVERWANELGLAKIGNSDSHEPDKLGTVGTVFPGELKNLEEIVAAIRDKKAEPYVATAFEQQQKELTRGEKLWEWTCRNIL